MKSYLESEDLWDIVSGASTCPPRYDLENFREWKMKNGTAEFVLKRSVPDELFDIIIDCESASSIWKALEVQLFY